MLSQVEHEMGLVFYDFNKYVTRKFKLDYNLNIFLHNKNKLQQ